MLKFNKIAIVGTGLIGGSFALACKKKKIARQIIGISRHRESWQWALRNGAAGFEIRIWLWGGDQISPPREVFHGSATEAMSTC